MRVFLDANVIFSASNTSSNIARLIEFLFDRGTAVTSDFAIEEARRNIQRKRPDWLVGFNAFLARIEVVPSVEFGLPIQLSAKDRPILCTAIRSECRYLVTGDQRDFGHLYDQTIEGVAVVSVLRLGELLIRASSEEPKGP